MKNVLFWFRNDLRLDDNEALFVASQKGKVIPVYIIDTRLFADTNLGFKRTSKFRAKFLIESLLNLKSNLKALGSDLIIKIGIAEIELLNIIDKYKINHVICSKEATQEETDVEIALSQSLKTLNIDIDLFWGNTLIHVRDLPFQIHYLPDFFTDFRKKIETAWKIRKLFPIPDRLEFKILPEDDFSPTLKDIGFEYFEQESKDQNCFIGGETHGLARLKDFIWETHNIENYKNSRNQLLGKDFSSKLSPWLSLGCISPRRVYEEIRKFEKEIVCNQSTHWMLIELLWRDYYHFISLKFGVRLFKRCGIKHDFTKKWRRNKLQFNLWMDGKTGLPLVDACMAELKNTGYLSNRGRQITANYFAKDLGIEWWWGAMYFESQLIDYEVCSNWGNWNYIAGIGTDPKAERYLNPILQGQKYDSEAHYIKYWLPQLSGIDSKMLIENQNITELLPSDSDYPSVTLIKIKKP